jgi:hypothetical protein
MLLVFGYTLSMHTSMQTHLNGKLNRYISPFKEISGNKTCVLESFLSSTSPYKNSLNTRFSLDGGSTIFFSVIDVSTLLYKSGQT